MLVSTLVLVGFCGSLCAGLPIHRNRQTSGVTTLEFASVDVRNSQNQMNNNDHETIRLHGGDRATLVMSINTDGQARDGDIQQSKGSRVDVETHGQANTLSSMTPMIPSNERHSILDIIQSNVYSREKRHAGKSKSRRRHRSSRRRHRNYFYWFDSLDSLGSGLIGK